MENNENKHTPAPNESNSAKRMRLLGDSTSEDIHLESDAEVKGSFWDNIWYRNKWAIIFGSIALVMLIILGFTLCSDEDEDMNIMYVGPEYVLHKVEDMKADLSLICEDYDEDGEIKINFATLVHQSPEQREELLKNSPDKLITPSANSEALGQFEMQTMSGELVIYLIDPYLYDRRLKGSGACVPVSEILGYELSDALLYDEGAVRFGKTDFATYFDSFDILPADTLMCVVKTVNTDSELYENSIDLFKSIVEFEIQ